MIDSFVIGGLEDYLAHFQPDAFPPLAASRKYDVLKTYEGLHQQAAWEAQWQAKAAQPAPASQPVPTPSTLPTISHSQPVQHKQHTRSGQKVGRNAPCPCGSGRKYKHCCGKKRGKT